MRSRSFLSPLPISLGLALLATACSDRPVDRANGIARWALLGATPSPSPDDDAVVLLRHEISGPETLCTATLIAPNLAVTARHCVSYEAAGTPRFRCSARGELIESLDGGGSLGAHVPAPNVEIRSGAVPVDAPIAVGQQIISTLSSTTCIDDLAFVVLDRDLDLPTAPIRVGRPTRAGEGVMLVGYGLSDDGVLDWRTRGRQRVLQRISAVGPDSTQGDLPTTVPRTFVVDGPAGCDGDSGGPAFSKTTGAVLGVYSTRQGACASDGVVHGYTNLSPFKALAEEAFRAAGATPKPEPPRLAFGESCTEPNECDDGVCLTAKDGVTRCSQLCSSAVPCPAGYACMRGDAGESRVCVQSEDAGCTSCDGSMESPQAASEGGCAMASSSRHSSALVLFCALCLAWLRGRRNLPAA